ncbi:MAG: Gfo/Idh/MocA family oxidoreductase [Candidatus Omnitrophica bacterium]|nr:Gfo/Idh/MocA family oxidoreductase [Candidatus Omnitrophota bacterium]
MFFERRLPKRDFYCGLVGCGDFARRAYVPALNEADIPVAISGLYSRSVKSARDLGKLMYYKPKIYPSYDKLASSGIRAVIITAPNHLHYLYVTESLNRNLDVFCEKPVANSLDEALRIQSILKDSGNILMVGFNRRYLDRIQKLKSIIQKGTLGKIEEASITHRQNTGDRILGSDWLSDKDNSGGGILFHVGIHLINMMIYMFGEVDSVIAELKNRKMPMRFGEDTAYCELFFKTGVRGSIKASLVEDVIFSQEDVIIRGDKAAVTSNMTESDIVLKDHQNGDRGIPCKKEHITESIYNELSYFYDCVKHRRRPDTDIDDSIETMRILKAAYLSAAEKRKVTIAEVKKK